MAKPAVTEGFPFDEHTLVLKAGGKMFAIISLDDTPQRISLKCDPERAIQLREEYASITAGYHLNKQLWNTIVLDGEVPLPLLRDLIDHSHALIVASLTRKKRIECGLEA
ncbi:MAG: MmcQ/YjbR family DNA-binding protein [Bacteroidetes bacterium]|nr:MmcQ/YjbR family DNA-binding protein [Bacteroidota bacterium]MDA0873746.1 MmcQ/YjbR family DNA-binding protein [Bacteroidota bacterium]